TSHPLGGGILSPLRFQLENDGWKRRPDEQQEAGREYYHRERKRWSNAHEKKALQIVCPESGVIRRGLVRVTFWIMLVDVVHPEGHGAYIGNQFCWDGARG